MKFNWPFILNDEYHISAIYFKDSSSSLNSYSNYKKQLKNNTLKYNEPNTKTKDLPNRYKNKKVN